MTDAELIERLREHREYTEVSAGILSFEVDVCIEAADRIEELIAERDQHWDSFVHWRKEADDRSEQLAAARRDAEIAEEELELQEEEACMMENSYLELKKERDALEAKLAKAEWLLTDAAVQLEEGKIKTRRNRAGLIWQFLAEIKGESHD